MQKWEYLFVNIKDECLKIIKEEMRRKKKIVMTNREAFGAYLNYVGKDGWEFCCVSGEDFLFKRPQGDKIEFHGTLFNDKSKG